MLVRWWYLYAYTTLKYVILEIFLVVRTSQKVIGKLSHRVHRK
jgi:hypothetical protein